MSDNFNELINAAFGNYNEGDCSGTPREYTTFLGMAVESFDCSTKWSGGSELNVTLYEDICGDVGREPAIFRGIPRPGYPQLFRMEDMIGSPYRFTMGNFEFCGLLQDLRHQHQQNGVQFWRATLNSPDSLASNISLILDGYYGHLDIGNVCNVAPIIEDNKSFFYRWYKMFEAWLEEAHVSWMSDMVTQHQIRVWGLPWVMNSPNGQLQRRAHTYDINRVDRFMNPNDPRDQFARQLYHGTLTGGFGSIGRIEAVLSRLQGILDNIMPTIQGGMYYNEILWAFNHVQFNSFQDANGGGVHSGVRFNHKSRPPHPDLIIDRNMSWWNGQYIVDLTELPGGVNSIVPLVPGDYRIAQSDLSLEDLVKHACDETDGFKLDYLWELRPSEACRVETNLNQLIHILDRKTQAAQDGSKDPYPNVDVGTLNAEIEVLQEEFNRAVTHTQRRLPILKLKTAPKNRGSFTSNARHIDHTVRTLRDSGVAVLDHSIGLQRSQEETPSVLLSGDAKEIIVVAANNLFNQRSFKTGHPFLPDVVNPSLPGEIPSVWRMYFGRDRFDRPQVMRNVRFQVPFNIRLSRLSGTTLPGPNMPTWAWRSVNMVRLDTYELRAQLRFFVNHINSDFEVDSPQYIILGDEEQVRRQSAVAYRVPDYIDISEDEIRASISFDLFWWTVCMNQGELYQLFVRVLNKQVAENVIFQGGFFQDIGDLLDPGQMGRQHSWMVQSIEKVLAGDRLSNVSQAGTNPRVLDIIRDDLQKIQTWISQKRTEYYGKHYVTPFYFSDITVMYDSNGKRVPSFEPQPEGFREYGGTDFMGLHIQNPLQTGLRGLESFTALDGKTQAFVRFFDPVRPITLRPPLNAAGEVIPNGWGNGLDIRITDPMNVVDPDNPTGWTEPKVYLMNTIKTDSMSVENMVRSFDWLYYKINEVKHIPHGNLVHITLDEAVFHYLIDEPLSKSSVSEEQMVAMYHRRHQAFLKEDQENGTNKAGQWVQMMTQRLGPNGPDPNEDMFIVKLFQGIIEAQSNAGAAYSIAAMTPKAAFPIDGCYGVKCHFVHYGPWVLRNGDNPGVFEKQQGLNPWKFGHRFLDPEESHHRMNTAGMLHLATRMQTEEFPHIEESGTVKIAGYPSLKVGAEIAELINSGSPTQVAWYDSMPFVGIYGGPTTIRISGFRDLPIGPSYRGWGLNERPYTGVNGPSVNRIEVNIQGTSITSAYSMNKYTPKDGMMAKHTVDRINRVSVFGRARAEDMSKEISRILKAKEAAYKGFRQRNAADYAAGKRMNPSTPHDVLVAQNADGTYPYTQRNADGSIRALKTDPIVRGAVLSGISAIDAVDMVQSPNNWLQKAFMSLDGLLAPYATTDVKEALVLEMLLRGIAEYDAAGNFRIINPAQARALTAQVEAQGRMNLPHMRKPVKDAGAVSPGGERYLDMEAWKDQIKSRTASGLPVNSETLNPLINPAHVDNNALMTSPAGERSQSVLGHAVGVISRGLVQGARSDYVGNVMQDNSPYGVHYRALSWSAPVQITGWGYNLEGKPIPRDANVLNHFSQNFAARRDLWATGPLDIRFDEKRGVWTFPRPKIYHAMMVENMTFERRTDTNNKERASFDAGYILGEIAGRQDRNTHNRNESGQNNPPRPLNARDQHAQQINANQSNDAWMEGYAVGYEHGFHMLLKPNRVRKSDLFASGPARVLNPGDNLESIITVVSPAGTPLRQGEQCLAWYDIDADSYFAISMGNTLGFGLVAEDVMPTVRNLATGTLEGGGLATPTGEYAIPGMSSVRVHCNMVQHDTDRIPAGTKVEWLSQNGVNWIINKDC